MGHFHHDSILWSTHVIDDFYGRRRCPYYRDMTVLTNRGIGTATKLMEHSTVVLPTLRMGPRHDRQLAERTSGTVSSTLAHKNLMTDAITPVLWVN